MRPLFPCPTPDELHVRPRWCRPDPSCDPECHPDAVVLDLGFDEFTELGDELGFVPRGDE